jgi:hypothetical protein
MRTVKKVSKIFICEEYLQVCINFKNNIKREIQFLPLKAITAVFNKFYPIKRNSSLMG